MLNDDQWITQAVRYRGASKHSAEYLERLFPEARGKVCLELLHLRLQGA